MNRTFSQRLSLVDAVVTVLIFAFYVTGGYVVREVVCSGLLLVISCWLLKKPIASRTVHLSDTIALDCTSSRILICLILH